MNRKPIDNEPHTTAWAFFASARALLAGLCLLLPGVAAADTYAYIPLAGADQVRVVNTTADPALAVALIDVGDEPGAVAVAPATGRVYVANSGSASVSVIDSDSFTVTATVLVAASPVGIAANATGTRVYVSHGFPGDPDDPDGSGVSVIRTTDNTVSWIPLPGSPLGYLGIAVHPDGSRVYVSGYGHVYVIDTNTNTLSATVDVPGIGGLAVHPAGTHVYVTSLEAPGSIAVIDTTDHSVVTAMAGSTPSAIAVHPDGSRVYVANYAGPTAVTVIDTATLATVDTMLSAGGEQNGIDVTPDGAQVFVTNQYADSYTAIDTASNTVIQTMATDADTLPTAFGRFIMTDAPVPPVLEVPDQNGMVGTGFTLVLAGHVIRTNGDPILGYAVVSGTLPPGLTLNAVTGVISGTPTAAGAYPVTLTATDKDGTSPPAPVVFTITAPAGIAPIPTLSEWAMILLAGLMGLFGMGAMRRRVPLQERL